jgi:4-hydroxy-tetrahydrodipicolinate synthase
MPNRTAFVSQGVIPAALLPFHDDLSIDEASFRAHVDDVASMVKLPAEDVERIRRALIAAGMM